MNKVTIEIDGKNSNAIASINGVEKKLLDLDRVGAGVTRSMGSLGGAFSGLINPSFLLGAGIASVATGAIAMIRSSILLAEQLNAVSQKTGISVEALSQLKYAAEQSETSLESLQGGLKKMSTVVYNAQHGVKEAVEIFKLLHITLSDDKGYKNNLQIFMEFADKFSQMEGGATKSALTTKIFGRALGEELIPMLNESSFGLGKMMREADSLGKTISTQTAKSADQFNDSLKTLGASAEGLAIKALPPLLNILNDFVVTLQNLNPRQDLLDFMDTLSRIAPMRLDPKQFIDVDLPLENVKTDISFISKGIFRIGDGVVDINNYMGMSNTLSKEQLALIKKQQEEAERLHKSWDDISLKLKNDIIISGLDPQSEKLFRLVMETDNLKSKFSGIPGAITLINDYLDVMLIKITEINNVQPKPLEKPKSLGSGEYPMSSIETQSIKDAYDLSVALGTELTTFELWQFAMRTEAAERMFGDMANASMNFYELTKKSGRTAFDLWKAFALAQAGITTTRMAIDAYGAMVGIPIVGPGLAIAAAIAATAFGVSNIARIASMQPGSSGGGGISASGVSMPSMSNIQNNSTTNYGGNRQYTINIYGFVGTDKDAIARDLIPALRKAEEDGV